MIIDKPSDITRAVLAEIERAPNPRFREIMSTAVRHLHAFIGEAKLTEAEFQLACRYIARLGQLTNESHNEVVLIAGSLGVSSLVCLLNNGDHGRSETTANLLGPFWRMDSPRTENGAPLGMPPRRHEEARYQKQPKRIESPGPVGLQTSDDNPCCIPRDDVECENLDGVLPEKGERTPREHTRPLSGQRVDQICEGQEIDEKRR